MSSSLTAFASTNLDYDASASTKPDCMNASVSTKLDSTQAASKSNTTLSKLHRFKSYRAFIVNKYTKPIMECVSGTFSTTLKILPSGYVYLPAEPAAIVATPVSNIVTKERFWVRYNVLHNYQAGNNSYF